MANLKNSLQNVALVLLLLSFVVSPSESFGCSPQICKLVSTISPFCCLFARACCDSTEKSQQGDSCAGPPNNEITDDNGRNGFFPIPRGRYFR